MNSEAVSRAAQTTSLIERKASKGFENNTEYKVHKKNLMPRVISKAVSEASQGNNRHQELILHQQKMQKNQSVVMDHKYGA